MMWKEIAEKLGLEPLEREGGLFKSTYRSEYTVDGRSMGSAIYFMLAQDGYSHLHLLPTDEVYHFYHGDAVELLELHPDGTTRVVRLGSDICGGEQVQHVVKGGVWQGSRLVDGGEYALMGTTMAPGFIPEEYIHAADVEELVRRYPGEAERIRRLTGEVRYR